MAVIYGKRWTPLDRHRTIEMKLWKISSIASDITTKLCCDEPVMLPVLGKICSSLKRHYGDIMNYVSEREAEL